ncbi:MAG: hypothetical protein E7463_02975 [Ruminococcaceae bacterium]|nr:hypothetical protein [Oscillospiraceae bacterium]
MKKLLVCRQISLMLMLLILLCACNSPYTDNTPYTYPLQPGTEEWASYRTKAEKIALLQIPEEKLNAMTTRALLETVLAYPYLSDYRAHDHAYGAYQPIYDTFNGLRELMARPDFADVLLKEYAGAELMTQQEYEERCETDPNGLADDFFYVDTLEFLLLCAVNNLDLNGRQEARLLALTAEKDAARAENPMYSASSGVFTDNYQPKKP